MAVRPGTFVAQDAMDYDAQDYGGGLIVRTAFTAAVLNSTFVNARPDSPDVWGDVSFGYAGVLPQSNKPVPFQYVQQDGYKGLLPWELLPQIPERNPWE